jgi:signal transduction histidine kinase
VISIRQRLLILLLGLWTTVWLVVALITLDRSGHEIAELLDAQLAQTARVLHRLTLAGNLSDDKGLTRPLPSLGHPYENNISFQLWRGTELISAFGGVPAGRLGRAPGFSDQDIAETRWRVFGLRTGRPDEILFVAQSYAIRQELIRYLTVHALQPILWSLPLTVLLIWFGVSGGLTPLRRLAADIGRRSPELLTPVDRQSVPTEVRPLTNSLNGLMEKLRNALTAERRFVADVSHELRTPLAIIRAHAQVARRSIDPRERNDALDHLVRGVDRATHLVSQLLTLARLEPDAPEIRQGASSLCETLAVVVEDKKPLAREKRIELTQRVPDGDPCIVSVHPSMLDILVRNLVANAIKYAPEDGWIRISVEPSGEEIVLRVADSGPGIPAAERERIFERFYRPAGQSTPGAGIGLSIVQRICELHDARIALLDGDDGSGLTVEVTFRIAPCPLS